jgi:hypothetical protein
MNLQVLWKVILAMVLAKSSYAAWLCAWPQSMAPQQLQPGSTLGIATKFFCECNLGPPNACGRNPHNIPCLQNLSQFNQPDNCFNAVDGPPDLSCENSTDCKPATQTTTIPICTLGTVMKNTLNTSQCTGCSSPDPSVCSARPCTQSISVALVNGAQEGTTVVGNCVLVPPRN